MGNTAAPAELLDAVTSACANALLVPGNHDDPALGGAKTAQFGAPEESWGKVIAIDPGTGTIKWEHKFLTPPWGRVMATGGNLVFGGTLEGVIFSITRRTA